MVDRQKKTKQELNRLLEESGILDGIRSGKYHAVVQRETTARMVAEGKSLIISYYDRGSYLCTIHQVRTKTGDVVHQDVEDIFIDEVRYER